MKISTSQHAAVTPRRTAKAGGKLVEPLEQRITPANFIWVGPGGTGMGGAWEASSNWAVVGTDGDGVPDADDAVTIDAILPGSVITVNSAQAALTLSMPGDDALSIGGSASLILGGTSTVRNLTLSGAGALIANGDTTLAGTSSVTDEAILAGTASISLTGSLAIIGGSPNVRTELRVASGGQVLHGDAYLDTEGLAGRVVVQSGGFYIAQNTTDSWGLRQFSGGAGTTIEASGIFRVDSPNDRLFLLNAGNGPAFNLAGSIEVLNGTLGVNTAGSWTNATLTVAADAALRFTDGANITVTGTLTGTGGGLISQQNSSVLAADAAGATLNMAGSLFQMTDEAALGGPGIWTNTGAINIVGGAPNVRTELRVASGGQVFHGDAHFDTEGAAGRVVVKSGGFYIAQNTADSWGLRQFSGGAGTTIEAGGIFRLDSPNDRQFLLNAGNGPAFNLAGSIQVLNGTLGVNTPGTWTNATLTVAADAALRFYDGANITVAGTLTGTGAGVVVQQNSSILAADAAGATLDMAGSLFQMTEEAALSGPGTWTNTGTINIVGGAPNVRTELRVASGGQVLHGDAHFDTEGVAGRVVVQSGGLYVTQGTQDNWGLRQFSGGAGTTIEAGGIFRHQSLSGKQFLLNSGNAPAFNLAGSIEVLNGTLGVNTPGTWTNATLTVAADAALRFYDGANITVAGTLTGTGAGVVVQQNSSVLAADAAGATLNMAGSLFQMTEEAALSGPGIWTNTGTINIVGGAPNVRTELRVASGGQRAPRRCTLRH